MKQIWMGCALVVGIAVFIGSSTIAVQPVLGLTLAAEGTWTASDGQSSGTWSAIYEAEGIAGDGRITEISGEITVTNMPGLTQGAIQGSLAPGTISFGIMYDLQEQGTFSGTVANGGSALSGTFTRPNGFAGTWQGTMTQGPPGGSGTTPVPE